MLEIDAILKLLKDPINTSPYRIENVFGNAVGKHAVSDENAVYTNYLKYKWQLLHEMKQITFTNETETLHDMLQILAAEYIQHTPVVNFDSAGKYRIYLAYILHRGFQEVWETKTFPTVYANFMCFMQQYAYAALHVKCAPQLRGLLNVPARLPTPVCSEELNLHLCLFLKLFQKLSPDYPLEMAQFIRVVVATGFSLMLIEPKLEVSHALEIFGYITPTCVSIDEEEYLSSLLGVGEQLTSEPQDMDRHVLNTLNVLVVARVTLSKGFPKLVGGIIGVLIHNKRYAVHDIEGFVLSLIDCTMFRRTLIKQFLKCMQGTTRKSEVDALYNIDSRGALCVTLSTLMHFKGKSARNRKRVCKHVGDLLTLFYAPQLLLPPKMALKLRNIQTAIFGHYIGNEKLPSEFMKQQRKVPYVMRVHKGENGKIKIFVDLCAKDYDRDEWKQLVVRLLLLYVVGYKYGITLMYFPSEPADSVCFGKNCKAMEKASYVQLSLDVQVAFRNLDLFFTKVQGLLRESIFGRLFPIENKLLTIFLAVQFKIMRLINYEYIISEDTVNVVEERPPMNLLKLLEALNVFVYKESDLI